MILHHLERTLLLASAGIAAEIVFTALCNYKKNGIRLIGYSYVWMLPIYMLLYPGFAFLTPVVGSWAWPLRGAFYAVLIMVFELITGLILRKTIGEAPWEPEYRGHKWAVMSLVRLDYFPAWAVAALVFERGYRLLTP
ncbi:MAG: hypothetical protein HY923_00760 [Elusimicrobia bacterium]|nr:hypothetical protein [Elusimicrobiota bacterium]